MSIRRVVERERWDLSSKYECLSPCGLLRTTDTHLLDGILCIKDSGEMGRNLCGEVRLCASALIVKVYNGLGWVSDGIDEMSGDHSVQGGLVGDQRFS